MFFLHPLFSILISDVFIRPLSSRLTSDVLLRSFHYQSLYIILLLFPLSRPFLYSFLGTNYFVYYFFFVVFLHDDGADYDSILLLITVSVYTVEEDDQSIFLSSYLGPSSSLISHPLRQTSFTPFSQREERVKESKGSEPL